MSTTVDNILEPVLKDQLPQCELELKLPKGFFEGLFLEDGDWAFLIKAHALLEAVITEQLISTSDSRLEPIFKDMSLGARTGKIVFARNLGILTDRERGFAQCSRNSGTRWSTTSRR